MPFIPASDSGSRLQNEFEIIRWIGKGGFGDVIKVCLISGCVYCVISVYSLPLYIMT